MAAHIGKVLFRGLAGQGRDAVAEGSNGFVDGFGLLEFLAFGVGLAQPLTSG